MSLSLVTDLIHGDQNTKQDSFGYVKRKVYTGILAANPDCKVRIDVGNDITLYEEKIQMLLEIILSTIEQDKRNVGIDRLDGSTFKNREGADYTIDTWCSVFVMTSVNIDLYEGELDCEIWFASYSNILMAGEVWDEQLQLRYNSKGEMIDFSL